MRRRVLWVLSALILCSAPVWPATNFASKRSVQQPIQTPLADLVPGERIVFDVYWMGFHVGRGTLEVKGPIDYGGVRAYKIEAHAMTNAFLSNLYPVHDEIHSIVEAGTLYSLEFSKILREGRYRANERIVYDYAAMTGRYESAQNGSRKEFPLPHKVRDLLATFYWFRLQSLEPGRSLRTQINSEEKNWDAEFKILRRERKEWRGGGGAWEVLVVEPITRLKGVLYDRGRAWVSFTIDCARIPIWITLKTPYGSVNGVLNIRESHLPIPESAQRRGEDAGRSD